MFIFLSFLTDSARTQDVSVNVHLPQWARTEAVPELNRSNQFCALMMVNWRLNSNSSHLLRLRCQMNQSWWPLQQMKLMIFPKNFPPTKMNDWNLLHPFLLRAKLPCTVHSIRSVRFDSIRFESRRLGCSRFAYFSRFLFCLEFIQFCFSLSTWSVWICARK